MLRAFFGTDNCLKTTAPAVNTIFADWWTSSGIPGIAGSLRLSNACIDQDGWLCGLSTSLESQITIDLTGLFAAAAKKITIAFRFKTLVKAAGNYQFLSLAPASAPRTTTDYLSSTGSTWMLNAAVNAELYIEATYTRATGLITYLVNGVAATESRTLKLSAGGIAAWDAGTLAMNFMLSGIGSTATARYGIRDIVVIDDVVGDGITGPIGPMRTYPLHTAVAAGGGWTPSAGTASLVDTLNLPVPGVVTINSPVDKTPLVTQMSSAIPQGARIIAIAPVISGVSLTLVPSPAKVEITGQGVSLPAKSLSIGPSPMTWNTPLGIYSKALDGSNWTTAKLAAVSIKLTPDTTA